VPSYDIKKALPALYAPKRGGFHVVDVPEIAFLMVDGHGDPNTSPAYTEAVTALYTLSYTVRAIATTDLGRVHTVGPLEGLWSADAKSKRGTDVNLLVDPTDGSVVARSRD